MQSSIQRYLFLFALLFSTCLSIHAEGVSVSPKSGFIPNAGQWNQQVNYRIGIPNGALFLRNTGLTYVLYDGEAVHNKHEQSHHPQQASSIDKIKHHAVNMNLIGAQEHVQAIHENPNQTRYNYYQGNNQSNWAGGLQAWNKVSYPNIYSHTDWILYSSKNGIKYDFHVNPGGNHEDIRMQFEGENAIQIRNNTLYIKTSLGDIIEQAPIAWQEENGVKTFVDVSFRENADGSIGFDVAQYNHAQKLIIDPQLIFATYSGSQDDNWGYTATYDNAGNGYSGGIVFGAQFSTTLGAYEEVFGGGQLDIGILKYTPDGSNVLYVTYIGGADAELPHSMIVNEYDELLIFGTTGSSDFPTTSGAYSNTFQGGPSASFENGYIQLVNGLDIFVCRLASDGSQMLGSTYVGGTGNDGFNGAIPINYADEIRGAIWVDANNDVYVGTSTQSSDFPITNGAIQQQYGGGNQDGVVFKLNGNLTQLRWSTYLGGSAEDGIYYLVVDTDNRAVVTGGTKSSNFPSSNNAYQSSFGGDIDGFVAIIDSTGNTLVGSTFIGDAGYDQSFIVGTDKTNHVYIFGQSGAVGDFYNINTAIGVPGGNQFLMKLDPLLNNVVWANAFGNATGVPDITPTALLVDLCDKIYCTGWGGNINNFGTGTIGLVTTPNAFQSTTDNNDFYLFVMDNQAQSLEYASFLGGALSPDHVDGGTSRFDRKGVIYQSICAGCGGQSDFPGLDSTSYSPINESSNCNNLLVKFDFESPITVSAIASITEPIGCAPYTAQFSNTSVNADIFSWRLNEIEIGSSSDLTYTFNTSGTYEVVLIASSSLTCNGSDTVSLTITVISEIEGSLDPITVCQGQEVTLGPDTFDDPYYQFQWSNPSSLSDGEVRKPTLIADSSMIYSVEIRVGTCIDTLTQELIVLGTSRIELAIIDSCVFDTIAVGPIGDYTAGTTFDWSPALGLSSTTDQNPLAYLNGFQNYVVLINRPEGCTDTLDVPVNGRFDTMNAGDDVNVCEGEPASIGVQDNSGLYTYSWTPTAFLTNPNSATPVVNVDENTQFNVIRNPLIGAPGCPAKDSVQVLIVSKPQALFGQVLYPDCQGMNAAFIDSSSDFTQLIWTFSNGEISQEENPISVFSFNDTLNAVLIVQNGACRDTFSFSEYINDISEYYKENDVNAFSPNDDGKNDCFSPAMQLAPSPQDIVFVPCSELKVFNRWGEIIFDSQFENHVCWDGKTSSGQAFPEGVYFYQYRFGTSEKAGFVHLKLN